MTPTPPPDARTEALAALTQVRDQLTVALDTLTRLHQENEAARQVGQSSTRLGTASYHLRRMMRDRQ